MIKRKSKPLLKDLEEGVYGVTGDTSSKKSAAKHTSNKRAPRKIKRSIDSTVKRSVRPPVKTSYIPGLDIKYDSLEMPKIAEGLNISNAVALSDHLLKYVKRKTELRTKNLSNLILQSIIPSMLACDASLEYTSTFLQSGFGFETSVDETIPASLTDLVRLEVLTYFIRVSKLPRATKRKLLDSLTEKFSERIVATIGESLSKKQLSDKVKDMEAFVLRTRSDNKVITSVREDDSTSVPSKGRGALKKRSK